MNEAFSTLSSATLLVCGILMGLGVLFSAIRLLRGPSLADRAVSMELLSVQAIGVLAIFAGIGREYLLNVASVLALVSFLTTMVFARYILHGGE